MLFFRPTAVPLPVRGNGMLIEPPGGNFAEASRL
jgi:hypothetical protein